MRRTSALALAVLALSTLAPWALPTPSTAVIIDSGDGKGNVDAPPLDPGWAHQGRKGSLGVVYLGNGWILTARHVAFGDVKFDEVGYTSIPGSRILIGSNGSTTADLAVWQIEPPWPELPILPIRATTPPVGTSLLLIGHGRNRGDPTSWMGTGGYLWGAGNSFRWGTNVVHEIDVDVEEATFVTRSFSTDFTEISQGGTIHEAQGALGDSGGAVFAFDGLYAELAGIIFTIGVDEAQPEETALYGNFTYAADLAHYRDEIIAIVRPECSDEVDDDGDTLVDFPDDPDCEALEDPSESPECGNGIDDDADGLVDFPDDPGCAGATDVAEDPQCDDGIDNDYDGRTDWDGGPAGGAPDPQCVTSWGAFEGQIACGLGFELALLVPPLALWHRRRQQRARG